jgi:hypothetical protein
VVSCFRVRGVGWRPRTLLPARPLPRSVYGPPRQNGIVMVNDVPAAAVHTGQSTAAANSAAANESVRLATAAAAATAANTSAAAAAIAAANAFAAGAPVARPRAEARRATRNPRQRVARSVSGTAATATEPAVITALKHFREHGFPATDIIDADCPF